MDAPQVVDYPLLAAFERLDGIYPRLWATVDAIYGGPPVGDMLSESEWLRSEIAQIDRELVHLGVQFRPIPIFEDDPVGHLAGYLAFYTEIGAHLAPTRGWIN